MADISRNDSEIVVRNADLFVKHLHILLSEKLNQIKALDVHLDHLRTVEMKRVEFKKDTLEREIQELKQEIKEKSS